MNTFMEYVQHVYHEETKVINNMQMKLIFLAGAPLSGKSSATIAVPLLQKFNPINVDIFWDRMVTAFKLGDKSNLVGMTSNDPQYKYYNIAYRLAHAIEKQWVGEAKPIIFETTGRSVDYILNKKIELERIGYKTGMIFVIIHKESAVERDAQVQKNAEQGLPGRTRFFGKDATKELWKASNATIPIYQKAFNDDFFLIYNEQPQSPVNQGTWERINQFIIQPNKKAKHIEANLNNFEMRRWAKDDSSWYELSPEEEHIIKTQVLKGYQIPSTEILHHFLGTK